MGARVEHGDDEIKRVVGITDNDEQGGFSVAYGVQLHFVGVHQLVHFRNIKGRKASTAGNKDGFCRLARNELSRTF